MSWKRQGFLCYRFVRTWQRRTNCQVRTDSISCRSQGYVSRLGTTSAKVDLLRERHGVYMVGDSRLNIAGLNVKTIPILTNAIIDCGI